MFNFLKFRFSSAPLVEAQHESHVGVLMRSSANRGTVSSLSILPQWFKFFLFFTFLEFRFSSYRRRTTCGGAA